MISSVLQEMGQEREHWDKCMCHMMTEEAENQSVPTGYLHTLIFQFLNFIFNEDYSVFLSILNIGYLNLESIMKCMLISQMT